jgi:hypothetical protein
MLVTGHGFRLIIDIQYWTHNCNTLTDLHTPQITRAHTKSCFSCISSLDVRCNFKQPSSLLEQGYRRFIASLSSITFGRAIDQAVSRRLPTATIRLRTRVRSCRICREQSGPRAGFLRVLRFHVPIRIPPIAPQSSSTIIWAWYSKYLLTWNSFLVS